VISSAESGNASAPLARNSQANNPYDLDTVAFPQTEIFPTHYHLGRAETRQIATLCHFYVYGIDASQNRIWRG
jgi:hypothetical protein